MNTLRTLTIRHRPTGESFPHTNFTGSIDESIVLARLTFTSHALWAIDEETSPQPPPPPPPAPAPTIPVITIPTRQPGPLCQADLF